MLARCAIRAGILGVGLTAVFASGASAATQEYEKGTVIVRYAEGASSSAISSVADRLGLGKVLGPIRGTGAQLVAVTGDPKAVAERLNRSSAVLYAEPNYIMRALGKPNDARFGELYGLDNGNDADLDAPEGWNAAGLDVSWPSTGGVKVGIVDTGIDQNHEDLRGKTVNCAATTAGFLGLFGGDPVPQESRGCADDNDHGSHVAGTISGNANNSVGVAGVAFNSPLAICKALHGVAGAGSVAGVANCITYLKDRGARIISMSLGGGSSTALQTAVRNANSAGVLLIAAAGNDGDATLNYPAAYPEVMSVAATDRNDQRASFSNANADVEIAAAGVDVLSVKRGGGYVAYSGTSMATPHVAGVAAVVMGTRGLTAAQTRAKLNATADDLGAAGRDNSYGNGRVNLNDALTQ